MENYISKLKTVLKNKKAITERTMQPVIIFHTHHCSQNVAARGKSGVIYVK